MSLVDPVALTVGVVAGAVSGLGISYFTFYAKPRQRKVKVLQRVGGELKTRTVRLEDLERAKRETKTLALERDLLSSALTKVYEAETQGRITREERESIARKYSEQLREMDMKFQDKELVVEVGELENLRDELVSLFSTKVENIEARLEQAKERLAPMTEELGAPETKAPVVPRAPAVPAVAAAAETAGSTHPLTEPAVDDLERVVERRAASRRDESEGERRAKQLRDEVMDALAKLEEIDTKKETEGA